jgi:hypothetical protein
VKKFGGARPTGMNGSWFCPWIVSNQNLLMQTPCLIEGGRACLHFPYSVSRHVHDIGDAVEDALFTEAAYENS